MRPSAILCGHFWGEATRVVLLIRSLRIAVPLMLLALALGGCRSTGKEMQGDPEVLYERAAKVLHDGDYGNAIKIYEALDARYPFSDAARQGRLDLMYAYYKDREQNPRSTLRTSSSARTRRIRASTTQTTSRGWCISSARRTSSSAGSTST